MPTGAIETLPSSAPFFSSLPLDFSLGLLSPFVEATKEAGEWLRLTAILPEMDVMTSAKPF